MRGNILASHGRIGGIVCCWSASAMNGMSGSYDWNWSFFADVGRKIQSSSLTIFPLPKNVETHTVGRLIVTTPLQTIVDLIRWDCEHEFVFQALAWWERVDGDVEKVWRKLEDNDLMQKYLSDYAPHREDWIDVY